MPATSPAAHFSKVFSDYLASAIALGYTGIPSLAAVPRRHLTSTVAITNPNLMVECEAAPESTDTLLTLDLKLVLTVQLGAESGQTTSTQAEAWLQAFRSLLSSDPAAYDAWDQWLLTLTDAERDGWYVQAIYPQTIQSDLAQETNLLTLTAPYQIVSYWNN